jgi:hypothetical protein
MPKETKRPMAWRMMDVARFAAALRVRYDSRSRVPPLKRGLARPRTRAAHARVEPYENVSDRVHLSYGRRNRIIDIATVGVAHGTSPDAWAVHEREVVCSESVGHETFTQGFRAKPRIRAGRPTASLLPTFAALLVGGRSISRTTFHRRPR